MLRPHRRDPRQVSSIAIAVGCAILLILFCPLRTLVLVSAVTLIVLGVLLFRC